MDFLKRFFFPGHECLYCSYPSRELICPECGEETRLRGRQTFFLSPYRGGVWLFEREGPASALTHRYFTLQERRLALFFAHKVIEKFYYLRWDFPDLIVPCLPQDEPFARALAHLFERPVRNEESIKGKYVLAASINSYYLKERGLILLQGYPSETRCVSVLGTWLPRYQFNPLKYNKK
ncbi:MAG: hypothetical protein MRY21_07340 [Simkaniaceae bacterium]|nr:hypothetical protein [Simkaniaceae bacterium]